MFDINNDGTVSQKELQRIVKDLFHLFKKDENTDKLNKDNLAEEAFKEMDANTGKYMRVQFNAKFREIVVYLISRIFFFSQMEKLPKKNS